MFGNLPTTSSEGRGLQPCHLSPSSNDTFRSVVLADSWDVFPIESRTQKSDSHKFVPQRLREIGDNSGRFQNRTIWGPDLKKSGRNTLSRKVQTFGRWPPNTNARAFSLTSNDSNSKLLVLTAKRIKNVWRFFGNLLISSDDQVSRKNETFSQSFLNPRERRDLRFFGPFTRIDLGSKTGGSSLGTVFPFSFGLAILKFVSFPSFVSPCLMGCLVPSSGLGLSFSRTLSLIEAAECLLDLVFQNLVWMQKSLNFSGRPFQKHASDFARMFRCNRKNLGIQPLTKRLLTVAEAVFRGRNTRVPTRFLKHIFMGSMTGDFVNHPLSYRFIWPSLWDGRLQGLQKYVSKPGPALFWGRTSFAFFLGVTPGSHNSFVLLKVLKDLQKSLSQVTILVSVSQVSIICFSFGLVATPGSWMSGLTNSNAQPATKPRDDFAERTRLHLPGPSANTSSSETLSAQLEKQGPPFLETQQSVFLFLTLKRLPLIHRQGPNFVPKEVGLRLPWCIPHRFLCFCLFLLDLDLEIQWKNHMKQKIVLGTKRQGKPTWIPHCLIAKVASEAARLQRGAGKPARNRRRLAKLLIVMKLLSSAAWSSCCPACPWLVSTIKEGTAGRVPVGQRWYLFAAKLPSPQKSPETFPEKGVFGDWGKASALQQPKQDNSNTTSNSGECPWQPPPRFLHQAVQSSPYSILLRPSTQKSTQIQLNPITCLHQCCPSRTCPHQSSRLFQGRMGSSCGACSSSSR